MGNSWCLNNSYIRQLIPSMHHLFKYFLLTRFGIGLVLFTYYAVLGVSQRKKVSLCIKSTIWHRLVTTPSIFLRLFDLLFWSLYLMISLSLDNRSIFPNSVNSLRLIAIIIEQWHMSRKLLLLMTSSVINGIMSRIFTSLISTLPPLVLILNLVTILILYFIPVRTYDAAWHLGCFKLWRSVEMWSIGLDVFGVANFSCSTFLCSCTEVWLRDVEVLIF